MKQFESFRLDTANHCLWRSDIRVSLTPKAFDVLRYLVENAGRLVTQSEILESVWPDTYVNPEVIKKYILGIRKVLGDRSDQPLFIQTFPKRGYQFVASVSDESTSALPDLPQHTRKTMVGRDLAVSQLNRHLDSALRGQRQLIFVTGEAGIGKTTLVDVFHQRAARLPNLRVARGQCVEGFGGKEAYYPMLEALGQLIRDNDSNPVAQTLAKRAPTWWVQFPSLVQVEKREALHGEILGATRERMVREICEALETITADGPLLLILEDLHWVDDSTLDLISALARRREPARLMVVGTYRPADVVLSKTPLKGLKQDLHVHHLCTEVALERLEEPAIAEYLAKEFPNGNLPSGLAKLIYRHSGGNALFMVAIVQDILKKGLVTHDNGRWKLTQPLEDIEPGVPETLQQMLDLQFDQLGPAHQSLLRCASVAGERFSVWAITTAMDIAPDQVEELCEGLVENQQFLNGSGMHQLGNGEFSAYYEFRHSLYRQAIYKRLSEGSRSKLHRALGQRLKACYVCGRQEAASEIALHFELGREYEQAVHYLWLTAETASGRFAHRDSIRLLRHALRLVSKVASGRGPELEIQLLQCIGDAHYALGEVGDAAEAYEAEVERALEAGITRDAVCALSRLAYTASLTDSRRGITTIERAVEVSRSAGDPTLLVRAQVLAAAFRLLHDRWREEDAAFCTSALTIVEQASAKDVRVAHEILYPAQAQILQGEYRYALNAESELRNITSSALIGYLGAWGKSLALMHAGRLGELLTTLQTLIDTAAKNGNKLWFCAFSGLEAWLRVLAFDFQGARKLCNTILPVCAGNPGRTPRAISLLCAGRAELGLGNHDEALRCFSEVVSMTNERFYMYWWWRMQAQLGLARTSLVSGDFTNARLGAGRFLEDALSTADPHMQVLAWEMKARLAMAEQDWVLAEESIEAALALLEKRDVPVSGWRVHFTAWEFFLLRNDPNSAEQQRARAEAGIQTLAASFPEQEPLRAEFLAAEPVRRVLNALAVGQ